MKKLLFLLFIVLPYIAKAQAPNSTHSSLKTTPLLKGTEGFKKLHNISGDAERTFSVGGHLLYIAARGLNWSIPLDGNVASIVKDSVINRNTIDTDSSALFVEPSPSNAPLMSGDFANDSILIIGKLGFTTTAGTATSITGRNGTQFTNVGTEWGIDLVTGKLEVDSSEVATKYDLSQISGAGDTDLLKFGTSNSSTNTDTAYRAGPLLLGDHKLVKQGTALLQINDSTGNYHSAIDIHNNNAQTHAMRIFSSDISDGPVSYMNAWGAYYTRGWMVISAVHSGTGDGFQIHHPSGESFMLGINSDVGGPGIQIRGNSVPGGHILNTLDNDGNHRFKIENDGRLLWGFNTLSGMDTDLWREDSARLTTSGALGYNWNYGTPTKIAGRNGDYFSDITLGSGLSFQVDTLNVVGQEDHDWYKVDAGTPDDITQDIYHEGNVHVGDNTIVMDGKLNVSGRTNIRQTLLLNNLFINGGNTTASGTDNVALQDLAGNSITSGSSNILIGKNAGKLTTTGGRNIAVGSESLTLLTTGSDNTAIGHAALANAVSVSNNTAVGARALNQTTGAENVGIGTQAGMNNTGSTNVFIGNEAGASSSGNGNVLIGYEAGIFAPGGSIHLGYGAGYNSTTANKLYIHNTLGANEPTDKIVSIIYGEMDATTANQNLHFNSKVLPRYMGNTSIGVAGYDESGYLSTVGTGWGIDFTSGNLVVDEMEVASVNNPVFTGTVTLPGYTVATLPAGTIGMMAYVTDAMTPTFMSVVVGGGAVVAKVFFDGTNWITQ